MSKNIFVNAFPWLFPGGIGGLYDSTRAKWPIEDWAKHLLRYCDGRFMKDQMFTLYVYNTIQRHVNNSQGNFFFKSDFFLGKEPPSLEDLQDDLRRGDDTYISKLQYFSQSIKGSDGYWRGKTIELENWINHHIAEGNGPPNFFITLSCAENWWPDLRRLMIELETNSGDKDQVELLEDDGEIGFKAMCKSARRWPLFVNEYFMERAKLFLDTIVKEALGVDHYWGRVEFAPGRGQIHLHLLAIAKDKSYLQDYHQAETLDEKTRVISSYAEAILEMTADVEIDDDVDYREDPSNSPLNMRYCEVVDNGEDDRLLCQACMVHHCNDYCLRDIKPEGPRECRVLAGTESERGKKDTKGWENIQQHRIFTDRRNIKHLQMKRTKSRRAVQHSKLLLRTWRANCDIKLIVYETDPNCPDISEIDNVIRYLVAYAGKKNKTHVQEKNIIHDLITR